MFHAEAARRQPMLDKYARFLSSGDVFPWRDPRQIRICPLPAVRLPHWAGAANGDLNPVIKQIYLGYDDSTTRFR